MKALLFYIFRHGYYKKVVSSYKTINSKCESALDIWCEYKSIQNKKSFDTKILAYKDLELIGKINHWIEITNKFRKSNPKTLEWFFSERHYSAVPTLHYSEYKLIADSESHINQLQCYLSSFNQLLKTENESVQRFLKPTGKDYSYSEISNIIQAKEQIIKNGKVLRNAHDCQKKYPRAWQSFANKRDFSTISLSELEQIKSEYFEQKDLFLKYYEESKNQVLLILGVREYCVDSFTEESYKIEKVVMEYYSKSSEPPSKQIVSDLRVKDPTELKRMILGSEKYGDEVNFVDSFTIDKFYRLRESIDKLGITFDTAIDKVIENREVVKDFNESQGGKRVVYIEDYVSSVTKGSELYNYIEHYKAEKDARDQAVRIHSVYSKGCDALFGHVNFQTCDIKIINSIIESKDKIVERDRIECEKERIRLEQERLRQERLRKQQELNQLRSCVSNWYTHSWNGSVKHKWYCDYYSYRDHKDYATSEMWDTWHFIWNFKNNKDSVVPISEENHKVALDRAVSLVENTLRETFGDNVEKLTLVCCTASTREKNDRRFKPFADRVCNDLNMWNGFNHITITCDGKSKSGGGDGKVERSYDSLWFKDKYIVLFDDVRTSGRSLEREKSNLETLGATVICAITLAQTTNKI